MRAFSRAQQCFSGIDATVLARLTALAADLVLVTDDAHRVLDLSLSSDAWDEAGIERWIGLPLAEVVAPDSRAKLDEMVQDARDASALPRWRQVNLRTPGGEAHLADCVVQMLSPGQALVLVARSLRRDEEMQQRLVQAHQAMERDYWQFRQAETRYRQLFQATGEGVLLLAADTLSIEQANPEACRLLGADERALTGQALPALFGADAERVLTLLAGVRATGRPADLSVTAGPRRVEVELAATSYRQGGAVHMLIRLVRRGATVGGEVAAPPWADLARCTPDGLLLTDPDGRVLAANPGFLELSQLGVESQAVGRSLDRWLGRSGVDLNVLLSNLRQRGQVRLFATQLRGELGAVSEVEIAGVQVSESPAMLGFTVRDVGRRLSAAPRVGQELPKSVDQLTELVGRVPLKDIVGETSELIEQLCIEAALELTRGNRAAAAEMLGLSRQSLYVKLRRYGLKDLDGENEK